MPTRTVTYALRGKAWGPSPYGPRFTLKERVTVGGAVVLSHEVRGTLDEDSEGSVNLYPGTWIVLLPGGTVETVEVVAGTGSVKLTDLL